VAPVASCSNACWRGTLRLSAAGHRSRSAAHGVSQFAKCDSEVARIRARTPLLHLRDNLHPGGTPRALRLSGTDAGGRSRAAAAVTDVAVAGLKARSAIDFECIPAPEFSRRGLGPEPAEASTQLKSPSSEFGAPDRAPPFSTRTPRATARSTAAFTRPSTTAPVLRRDSDPNEDLRQ
jgi:hypothetical protein